MKNFMRISLFFVMTVSVSLSAGAAECHCGENEGELISREISELPGGDLLVKELYEIASTEEEAGAEDELGGRSVDNILWLDGTVRKCGDSIIAGVCVYVWEASDIHIKMELQKKSGESWITVKSWEDVWQEGTSAFMAETYDAKEGTVYRLEYEAGSQGDCRRETTPEIEF